MDDVYLPPAEIKREIGRVIAQSNDELNAVIKKYCPQTMSTQLVNMLPAFYLSTVEREAFKCQPRWVENFYGDPEEETLKAAQEVCDGHNALIHKSLKAELTGRMAMDPNKAAIFIRELESILNQKAEARFFEGMSFGA